MTYMAHMIIGLTARAKLLQDFVVVATSTILDWTNLLLKLSI